MVAMMIPWNLSGASAADATPPDQPVQEAPATEIPASTEVPVATDVPVEPTATTPSTEVSTATSETLPTETSEPEMSAALILQEVEVEFLLCGNDDRIGQTDLQFFGGAFSGAETSQQCVPANGVTVTLTDITGVSGPYEFNLGPGQAYAEQFGEVAEGTYSVSFDAAGLSSGTLAEQVVLTYEGSDDGYYKIAIQYFVEMDPEPDPIPVDQGRVDGEFASCRNEERAGQTDFVISAFTALSDSDLCERAEQGQASFTLEGTTSAGAPYGPNNESISFDGKFDWDSVPFGTYTITESIYGNESEPFTVGGSNGNSPSVLIRNYYGTEPDLNVPLRVTLHVCADPLRAGEVDYLAVDITEFVGTASCALFELPLAGDGIDLTLFDSEGNPASTDNLAYSGDTYTIHDRVPGTYTAQLASYEGSDSTPSQPFELVSGQHLLLEVFLYVDAEPVIDPVPIGGEAYLGGEVAYCTSDELAGQVQYLIDADYSGAATGECVASTDTGGVVFVHRYENSGDPDPVESWTYPVVQSQFVGDPFEGLPAGIYRVGYAPSAFSEPIELSLEFPLYDSSSAWITVYYFGAEVETSVLQIRKDICYSDAKAGTTDFFFQQEEIGLFYATDETTQCRVATLLDGQFTFTLTNVDTLQSVEATGYVFPVTLAFMGGIPAGTYTLTEEIAGLTRTSEPFAFDPGGGDYSVLVRNYVAGEMPSTEEPQDGGIMLWAYDCVSDAKAGTSEFYYNPGIVGTDPIGELPLLESQGEFSAAGVENCVAAGQYTFALDDLAPPDDVSGAAVYPMIQGPTGQEHVHVTSMDGITPGNMPAGTYVIRELTTGSVSEPIDITIPITISAFYRFAAAPTPTPTATTEPTVTPTVDPSVTVTPTIETGTVEPGGDPDDDATATADASDDATATAEAGGSVTTLPSTGQGQAQSWNGLLQVLLLTGLALILLAAGIRQHGRRQ
jgi:hypothetical protein